MNPFDKFILGTVQFGLDYGINNQRGRVPESEVLDMLDLAWEYGVRTLDTAAAYGESESLIGKWHRSRPHRFRMITKLGHTKGVMKDQLLASMDRLACEEIHGLLFHLPQYTPGNAAQFSQMLELAGQGLIRKPGLSLYHQSQLEEWLSEFEIPLVQFPFNLLDNRVQRSGFIALASSQSIELQVRSVFLQGLFFMDTAGLPDFLKPLADALTRLQTIAQSGNMTMLELAASYALSQSELGGVLFGADSLSQLQQTLEAANTVLAESTLREIDDIVVRTPELLQPYNWK